MLKRSSYKRIILATIALLVTGIIYIFPDKDYEIPKTVTYHIDDLSPIYLIDENDYVVRTEVLIEGSDEETIIREIVGSLTIDSDKSVYLPDGFKPVIPKNTQILDYSIENKLLKINFSSEFKDVSEDNENKLIESIVYSITENTTIENIMIFVEGTHLLRMPASNKRIPALLNRDFGINKFFDLKSLNNVEQTTVYFIGGDSEFTYYVPVTYVNNDTSDKVEIIIEQLKTSPIYQNNVMSYLAASVQLLDYEIDKNIATLNFNDELFSNDNILEEVKYTLYLSVRDNFDVDGLEIEVNDELVASLGLE